MPENYRFGASFVNDLQQTSIRASFLRQTKKLPDTLSDFTSVLFHFNPHTYYVNITFPLSHSRRHCAWCILIFTLFRGVARGRPGGPDPPLEFGRSVNPIGTRVGRFCPSYHCQPPRIPKAIYTSVCSCQAPNCQWC